jgi:hypothetical protein
VIEEPEQGRHLELCDAWERYSGVFCPAFWFCSTCGAHEHPSEYFRISLEKVLVNFEVAVLDLSRYQIPYTTKSTEKTHEEYYNVIIEIEVWMLVACWYGYCLCGSRTRDG